MAITWITPAGDLGILQERVSVNIQLQASTDTSNPITYTLIAGSLPRGLRLDNGFIKGSPTEVIKYTESRFVIRANDGTTGCGDRTFKLAVDGADFPEWITQEGFLNVGDGQSYFVLDDAYVDFQLSATDPDAIAGDTLEYYLVPNSGILPYGLSLSKTGRITGFTLPTPAIDYNDSPTGAYDTHSFDTVPLDIAKQSSLGFDSYFYDNQNFDYSETSRTPRKLSRIFTFGVAVTDGETAINRIFKIYVVTAEFLQADNTLLQVDTNLFQADNSNDRVPFWITDSYLGRWRANNFVTINLDVYDPPSLAGTLSYFLLDKNTDGTDSTLPPGLILDQKTGELSGAVPYQAAVTNNYKFTLLAVNFPTSLAELEYNLTGNWSSTRIYQIDDAVRYDGLIYTCIKAHINFTPSESEYWTSGVASSEKTFNIDIIGEIESAVEWVSDSNIGTIKPNQPSKLYVQANSLLYGGIISYSLIDGELPPGLTFLSNGLIQGKVIQFADSDQEGLTRFFDRDSSEIDSTGSRSFNTSFDNDITSFDKEYKFTIRASDGANFAQSDKEFTIKVIADRNITYSNLYCKALQPKQKRLDWFNFITDATIFVPNEIYRYGDQNYGIQTEIQTLLFAGIESKSATEYVQAISRNHYRKRFTFGEIKTAKGKDPITQETLYEVVYVDLVDDLETDGKSISNTVELANDINSKILVSYNKIKVDSDIPFASDADLQRVFPNSVQNMRERIQSVGERDREFLPLWMRSIQDQAQYELGYTKAMVLCYAKPGFAESIISRIKNSNFDFKTIDFTADRYVIDILGGEIQEKYIAFPQREVSLQNENTINHN